MASFKLNLIVLIAVLAITSAKNVTFLRPRIIGGHDATAHQFPYQVSLRNATTNQHFCGGAILSINWILTSAQCVDGLNEHDFIAEYGTNSLSQPGIQNEIKEIYIHPDYNTTTLKRDVCMLLTKTPIVFVAHIIGQLELPKQELSISQPLVVSGWGVTKPNPSAEFPDLLQFQWTRIITLAKCRQLNPHQAHRIHSSSICTYRFDSMYRSVCVGDLGDPLVSKDNILYGIVSLFDPECMTRWPDLYTNVYAHIDWIRFYIDGF